MKKEVFTLVVCLAVAGALPAYAETAEPKAGDTVTTAGGVSAAPAASNQAAADPSPVAGSENTAGSSAQTDSQAADPAAADTSGAASAEQPAVQPQDVEPSASENLEFVSGEVSAADTEAKTLSVKLYGEIEGGGSDKTITVNVSEATDITDGEKDRDLKSLSAGTEVDLEYDPTTNKATYIFVY